MGREMKALTRPFASGEDEVQRISAELAADEVERQLLEFMSLEELRALERSLLDEPDDS